MGEARLYDLPSFEGQDDYIPDAALERLGTLLLPLLPLNGFDLSSLQAHTKSVTATIHFDKASGPEGNAKTFEAMLTAATVIRTLHANLVAARAALRTSATAARPSVDTTEGDA